MNPIKLLAALSPDKSVSCSSSAAIKVVKLGQSRGFKSSISPGVHIPELNIAGLEKMTQTLWQDCQKFCSNPQNV